MTLDELRSILTQIGVQAVADLTVSKGMYLQLPCPLAPWFHEKKVDIHPSMSIRFGIPGKWTVYKCWACIPGNDHILTSDGLKRLHHIKIGDRVWADGDWQCVTDKRRFEKPLIELRVAKNRRRLRFSPEHKVFTWNGWLQESKVRDLEVGDYLVYSCAHQEKDITQFDLSKYRGRCKLPKTVELTDELLRLVGLYVAEGSGSPTYRSIEFTYGPTELQYAIFTAKTLRSVFGMNTSIDLEANKIRVRCSSIGLARMFTSLCGIGSENKHIPFEWMNLPLSKLKILFKAIDDGDGLIAGREITTTSETLATQLWDIAAKLRLSPSWYGGKKLEKKDWWQIRWSGETQTETRYQDDFYLMPIREIQELPVEDVVDISVQGERFNYRGILSHNCHEAGKLSDLVDSLGRLQHNKALVKLGAQLAIDDKPQLSTIIAGLDLIEWIRPVDDTPVRSLPETILDKFISIDSNVDALQYVRNRGVLVWQSDYYDLMYDPRQQRIVFPVRSIDGELLGAVGRSIHEKVGVPYYNYFGFPMALSLGGVHKLISGRKTLVVCEGYFDMISARGYAWKYNFDPVCVFHAQLSPRQVDMLLSLDRNIVIGYDNDKAGNDGWEQAKEALAANITPIKRFLPPVGVDLGDIRSDILFEEYW